MGPWTTYRIFLLESVQYNLLADVAEEQSPRRGLYMRAVIPETLREYLLKNVRPERRITEELKGHSYLGQTRRSMPGAHRHQKCY